MSTLAEILLNQIKSEYPDQSSADKGFEKLSKSDFLYRISDALELRLNQLAPCHE